MHFETITIPPPNVEAFAQDFYNPLMEDEEEKPMERLGRTREYRCHRCGQTGHFVKDCFLGNVRCQLCMQAGHVAAACPSYVTSDVGGKPRLTVTPSRRGAAIKVKFDNNMPEAVETMGGVVNRLSTTYQKRRDLTKKNYRERQALKNKPVKPRPEHQVLLQEGMPVTYTDDEGQSDEGSQSTAEVADQCWVGLITEDSGDVVRSHCLIDGKRHLCVMDSGAKTDCISLEVARKLNVLPDQSVQRSAIRGVGGMAVARVSRLVRVVHPLSPEVVVITRFRIVKDNIPTLIGRPTLSKLGVILDLKDKSLSIGNAKEALVLSVVEESNAEAKINTLTQQQFASPEEAVNSVVSKIEVPEKELEEATVQLKALLVSYADLYWEPKAANCKTHSMRFKVVGEPRRFKPRPQSQPLMDIMYKQVDELEKQKVILPMPDNEWAAPCMMVPKKGGTNWRLVIDYRYINSLMEDDPYLMPDIVDIFNDLRGRRYFSLIDLNWGFWNLPVHEDCIKYTGFAVPNRGIYVWVVTPFGLKVSPTHFQRSIEIALQDLLVSKKVKVYVDDIVVATTTVDDHLKLLQQVLQNLRESGFYINLSKAHFLHQKIELLGHVISYNKLAPDPKKIQGIVDAKPPSTKEELKSFLAAASFLRQYIPAFSEIVAPLTELLKRRAKFEWLEEQQSVFNTIKQAMLDATYLVLPDFSLPFHLFVDASDVAVGAALCQIVDGSKQWVAFASKKLNEGQQRWSTTEREVYAIVFGCEKFERYLKGCKAVIHSDHAALTYLRTASSPKLKRWALRLLEFGHEITYVPGENNEMADWLSRSRDLQEEELPPYAYVPLIYYLSHDPSALPTSVPSPTEMKFEAKKDEANQDCVPLKWYNEVAYHPKSSKIYIPVKFRKDVVKWFHGSRYGGHQGIRKTEMRIKKYVWWPHMRETVEEVINSCPVCLFMKSINVNRTVKGVLNKPQLFEIISLDFVGPRQVFGSKWHVLVIVDHCSRFMCTAASPSPSASTVIETLKHKWIPFFGVPGALLCDHGGAFIAKELNEYVQRDLHSCFIFTSVQYPQGNAINESSHRILELAIKSSPNWINSDFPTLVSEATLVYNATPNLSIGDTPSSFLYGCDPCLPGLESFYGSTPEDARRVALKDRRTWQMLKEIVSKVNRETSSSSASNTFSPGDIVSKQLTESELPQYEHISGTVKYGGTRSFPYRVLSVKDGAMVITPLLSKHNPITVPKAQCKKVTSSFDQQLCNEASKLFPKLRKDLLQLPLRPPPSDILTDPEILPTTTPPSPPRTRKSVRLKRAREDPEPYIDLD